MAHGGRCDRAQPDSQNDDQRYYKRVSKMSYEQRDALAGELIADASPLVEEFTNSIATLATYSNPDEGFYRNTTRAPKPPDSTGAIVKTHHVAWYLREQQTLEVDPRN